jgi:hypothetical protein
MEQRFVVLTFPSFVRERERERERGAAMLGKKKGNHGVGKSALQ